MDNPKKARFMKIRHKVAVIKENIKKSQEIKAFLGIIYEIIAFGILGGMSLLVFMDVHILIKFLGIGCFIWLFKEKLYPLICGILASFTLVHNYK
jgi:nitrate reductase NapE component